MALQREREEQWKKEALEKKAQVLQKEKEELEKQVEALQNEKEELEKEPTGKFYDLEEAYNNGLLLKEDIEQIAYYHNNNNTVKYPEALDKKIEREILETAAYNLRHEEETRYPEATVKEFSIRSYYGNYNGCYAVMVNYSYTLGCTVVLVSEVAGVRIVYGETYPTIKIWKNTEG